MAKPLLCRLRLHKWDDRDNPETHAAIKSARAVTPTATGETLHRVQVQLESPDRVSDSRVVGPESEAERRQREADTSSSA